MFDLGSTLRELRTERNMTQEDVARSLEVSVTTVNRWENNNKKPSLEHMTDLAVLYNVSLNRLVGIKDEAVIIIEDLTGPQKKLLMDIANEFTYCEKRENLSKKQREIICNILAELL